ncbi:MAG TPA: sensor histidine kinase [Firmicutes bacterium]|nr:sensor histidine kinase [Bacillota bacterium]
MNKKEKPPAGGSFSKIRFSLALKLNLRMLGMLLSVFISMNLLLSILLFGTALWQAEAGARKFIAAYDDKLALVAEPALAAAGYEISMGESRENGLRLPGFIQNRLPLNDPEARRWLSMPGAEAEGSFFDRVQAATYHMTLVAQDTTIHIVYALEPDLRQICFILLILAGSQFLYFIGRIGTNNQVIRQTLKPLTEMAETAKSIHQDMSGAGPTGAGIKRLAGAISTINASALSQGLSIDTSQEELKDLAYAINDMLQRINQAYQSQVRFVADASHELRTPLSVLQGYADLLDRWGKHDERTMQEAIDAIKSETENMKVLVEQLLFLARGDNETIPLEKVVFDAREIVAEIVRETRLIDPAHTFQTELDGPAYLEADQHLIKQALRILVDNSIKYTPEGGTIRLKVGTAQDTVKIQVQDDGIGIPPADVPRIFDRFYRSDQSRARKTGGSGLGLAIAKWIIDHHGGYYEVLSRLGIGTRITINFPAARPPLAGSGEASGGSSNLDAPVGEKLD